MTKVTIEIKNEELFKKLESIKNRSETWKNYLILCMIRDIKRRMELPGGYATREWCERTIKLLQLEAKE